MRSLVLGSLALVALSGCNMGQPRLWRVAIDMTPIRTIANPSCFRGNILPSGRGQLSEVNYRESSEWVIWDGVEGKQYLDIGTKNYKLGDSPEITVSDLIEGTSTDRVFSAQRNEVKPYPGGLRATESRQTQIVVTWSDYGTSPTGTVALTAQYACVNAGDNCPNPNPTPDSVSCNSQLNFVARRVEFANQTIYGNTGK